MEKKGVIMLKCSKCQLTLNHAAMKLHQCCIEIKEESESSEDERPTPEIEFLESDFEEEAENQDDELTDYLTADWSELEVALLLNVTITQLEKGEIYESEMFWTKLMAIFNRDERWPLFVVQAKLRQLRQMFQDNGAMNMSRQIYRQLLKISHLEKRKPATRGNPVSGAEKSVKVEHRSNVAEDEDNDCRRWTGQEIQQLVKSYKRHLKDLLATPVNKEKRKIWDKIAAEIQMPGLRPCDPYSARMKIMNLKKTWCKHKNGGGRLSWTYFPIMDEVMKLEEKVKTTTGMADSDCLDSCDASSDEDSMELNKKRFKGDSEQPEWFLRFRQESRRRHYDKMRIKMKLLDVLEGLANKISK